MSDRPVRPRRGSPGRGLVLALAAALCWVGWFAWDDTYQTDPVTGVVSGPYEAWQVLGAVVTLSLVAGIGALWAGVVPTIVAVTAGFTVAWSVSAASSDDSGLWAVGAVLVLGGVALGSALVALLVTLLARRRRRRP